MELESDDGVRVLIDVGSKVEIGRGLGLGFARRSYSSDRTVSRRHLCLSLYGSDDSGDELTVSFEVIGKNPILVCSRGGAGKRVFRNSEKGQLRPGDRFSLSLKNRSFFVVGRRDGGKAVEVEQTILDAVERREKRTLERRKEKEMKARAAAAAAMESASPVDEAEEDAVDGGIELELGSINISEIDPVREFGFLVKGHEFDQYPKQKIRPMKDWNWFLDETARKRDDADDDELTDEATSPKRKGRRRKKTKGEDSVDEDWTGESEDEKVSIKKAASAKRPKYSTRSKDPTKPRDCNPAPQKDVGARKDAVDEQDEEDELGGFIVNDDDEEEANGEEWDDEEEDVEEDYEEEDDN